MPSKDQNIPLSEFIETNGIEQAVGVTVIPNIIVPTVGSAFKIVSINSDNGTAKVHTLRPDNDQDMADETRPAIEYNIHLLKVRSPKRK
jgi:hypothetical protein